MVAPDVRRLTADNPSPMTQQGTNSYLLGEADLVVVDAGPDLPAHLDALAASGRIVAQVVTHSHSDHLPGAIRLRERVGAPIWGHADLPGVDYPLADGQEVKLAGWRLRALATPGHAADHLCFWVSERRLLFTGDLIAGAGTIVLSEVPNALGLYLDSLAAVGALGPATLLPGHGPIVDDGQAKIAEYVEHRLGRERQVVAALGGGPLTVDELVARIYVETPAALWSAAARNVRAHLERLQSLGRAQPDGERWGLSATGDATGS